MGVNKVGFLVGRGRDYPFRHVDKFTSGLAQVVT